MKFNYTEFKNIKSFGNKVQRVTFDKDGQLILLVGRNGTGKTTIRNTLDLTLYGKVISTTGNKLANKHIPNRTNKNLFTSVNFINNNNNNIVMTRGLDPNTFSIEVDRTNQTENFKNMSPEDRENLIGYPYDVFKSFISLSINEFKNFINLTTADKRTVMNKLFNVNRLDTYAEILKQMIKPISDEIEKLKNQIENNKQIKLEYNSTLKKFNTQENIQDKLSKLKENILAKKPEYSNLENLIKNSQLEFNTTLEELKKTNEIISNIRIKTNEITNDLIKVEDRLELYKEGVCPYCDTELNDKIKFTHLDEEKIKIDDTLSKLKLNMNTAIINQTAVQNKKHEIENKINEHQTKFNTLKIELTELNSELKILKESEKNIIVEDIKQKYTTVSNTLIIQQNRLNELEIKLNTQKSLLSLYTGDEIRSKIIGKMIKPINDYLKKYLIVLESQFTAELDNQFNATIFERGRLDIPAETMSKGETAKMNIAIALSYLNMVISIRKTNLIFLDELFDGVDTINVDLILILLKDLAKQYNINIIVVHHNEAMNISLFDRIIRTKKDVFSDIVEDVIL